MRQGKEADGTTEDERLSSVEIPLEVSVYLSLVKKPRWHSDPMTLVLVVDPLKKM